MVVIAVLAGAYVFKNRIFPNVTTQIVRTEPPIDQQQHPQQEQQNLVTYTPVAENQAPAQPGASKDVEFVDPRVKAHIHFIHGPAYKSYITFTLQEKNPLNLNPAQIAVIQSAYNDLVEARMAIESQSAKAEQLTQNEKLITIPAHPEQPQILLTQFDADVSEAIGPNLAGQFMAIYQTGIVAQNNGLGAVERNIDVEKVSDSSYQITEMRVLEGSSNNGSQYQSIATSRLSSTNLDIYSHLSNIILSN